MALDPTTSVDATRADAAGRLGFWIGLVTAALTVVTFALALTALPDAVPYPFTSQVIVDQWPGDYVWMYPAMVLMVLFVALLVAIHESTPPARRTYSLLALCVGVIAAAVLLITYYIQVTVMQPSLEKGQLDGWAMLTNVQPERRLHRTRGARLPADEPRLPCLAGVFVGASRLERSLRGSTSRASPCRSAPSLSSSRWSGIDRGDLFEIIVISIVWLTLIAGGILTALVFRRAGRQARS